jgi:outer membrane protein OmpA-like peptidoglycan-associated protein
MEAALTPHHPSMRTLTAIAVILSLLLHALLFLLLKGWGLNFGKPLVDPVEPPRFNVQQVEINPKYLEPPEPPRSSGANPSAAQRPVELDPEKIASFSGALNAPKIPTPRISADEAAPLSATAAPVPADAFSALPLDSQGNIPQVSQALAQEASTAALKEANLALAQGSLAGGGGAATQPNGGVPGYDDLASLVQFRPPTATIEKPAFQPILLRLNSDVLFAFDSADLLPAAGTSLQQVADFLTKAVKAKVTVEGYTDTFGADDYNMKLSVARAQSVATWLAAHSSLPPASFAVKGYGKTKPLVNPQGTIEQQAPNRRVDIRIEAEK